MTVIKIELASPNDAQEIAQVAIQTYVETYGATAIMELFIHCPP